MSLEALEAARGRTLALVLPWDDDAWRAWPDPDFSPICWHLGHLAFTEAFWVLQRLGGDDRLCKPFARRFAQDGCPKRERTQGFERGSLLAYLDEVRDAVREAWPRLPADHPLVRDGFLSFFLACHEHQHRETMALVRARALAATRPPALPPLDALLPPATRWTFERTRVVVGTDAYAAYDNERPATEVEVGPFALDTRPVSAGEWLAFVRDDGYARPELWSPEGRAFLARTGVRAPRTWVEVDDSFAVITPAGWRSFDARVPVVGISAHEADAYARWRGARLPTEEEWELATRHHADDAPVLGRLEPAPMGGRGELLGQVWEWTASDFSPRPGFRPHPYRGYSVPWFGDHRVLRGGSFATDPAIATPTFRNFFLPETRSCFAGLRLGWKS